MNEIRRIRIRNGNYTGISERDLIHKKNGKYYIIVHRKRVREQTDGPIVSCERVSGN